VIFGLRGRLEPFKNKESGVPRRFEKIVILQAPAVRPGGLCAGPLMAPALPAVA
jgi:hypothetical protein